MNLSVLDNPVWNTLTTRHRGFAIGDDRAVRFRPDISPFAATRDSGEESLTALGDLLQTGETMMLMAVGDISIPPTTKTIETGIGVQMVARRLPDERIRDKRIEPLGAADAPEMLALATLTKPGPFAINTPLLGEFIGIKIDGVLAAMAGERMKHPGLTEISGICTHPDYRGQGLAKTLSALVTTRIFERGETPYLHAYEQNTAAIKLYEKLGYSLRSRVNVALIERA